MLEDKKIVIVGGSSGIGLSLAMSLHSRGSEVAIASRAVEKLQQAKAKLSGSMLTYQLDASKEKEVKQMFAEIGTFDHLIATIKPEHLVCDFKESATNEARMAFDAKFWGQYNLTRHCLNTISQQGSIVLTSGIAAQKS